MARESRTRKLTGRSSSNRLARVVSQGAVAAVVISTFAVLGQQSVTSSAISGADVTTGSDLQLAARRSSCRDSLIVAIDGNGEGKGSNTGQTTSAITRRVQKDAAAAGRTVDVRRVRMKSVGAKTLLRSKRGPAAKAIGKAGVNRWKKPIQTGVKTARVLVKKQLAACPEQQVLLVGYAQGAAVAHRVVQDLKRTGDLGNVAGAVLISDPYRVRKSNTGRPLGKPGAANNSEGLLTRFAKSTGDVPAREGTFRAVSVCHKGDLVCHPGKQAVTKALSTATSYAAKGSRDAMNEAAERAVAQLSLWPVPNAQPIAVTIGTPISQQLTVSGGSPSAPQARWTATSVPAGLSLSPEGVLSGTISAPGVYEVRYSVAGVSPATSPKSGLLLVSVRAESGASAAGGMTSCEVRSDSSAWCWGRNDFGQVGDATNVLRTNPTPVVGTGWARIATGGSTTCGVKTDGTLWCWGLNNFGQLGTGDRASSNVPRQVGTTTTWKDVSAGWFNTCATQTDGSLWCWGQNVHGQVGNGKSAMRVLAPNLVTGGRQWASVAVGPQNTCATTTAGEGYCWGINAEGQVGDGTTIVRWNPALVSGGQKFSQFSVTWNRACGITTSGQALCWGDNTGGELGNGTRTDSVVPVAVPAGSSPWSQIAASNVSTCATQTNGQVWCWGDNRYGGLGPAAAGTASTASPIAAGVSSTGAIISAGWYHSCAPGYGCWGSNDAGQLGNGLVTPNPVPAKATLWGPPTKLSHQQTKKWSAKRIARTAIASRPSVSARDRRRKNNFAFEMMTFNLLGSQHTAPTGGRPAYAPGRVRTEWARNIIEQRGASLVGLSEPQPDQISSLNTSLRGEWTFYPGNTAGYDPAPQSVMWKDSEWDYVWANTAQMPFMRKSRPQAVVRLRHRASGRQVYLINAHLSPGKMQADRNKGMAIIVELVKQLNGDGLPILVTGDLNEHAKAFRKIACQTNLRAAIGGRASKKKCVPPKAMRVDWIFGSRGSFSNTTVDITPRVRRTTDHAVVSSRFSVQ